MTKRLKRHRDFEISVQIKNDDFIRPPRDAQRNWLLNGTLNEFSDNLLALNTLARRYVPGSDALPTGDRSQAVMHDEDIMEDWQLPLMQAMAEGVTEGHGHVLEIGFGRGAASTMIQRCGVESHTIIECNDSIVGRFNTWKDDYPGRDIKMVHGMWQDTLPSLGTFDGIFFHTYPLNEAEFVEQIGESTTFAEHFFEHAAQHLVDGGRFTYLSNEMDSLSRTHQRLLFRYFDRISIRIVENLNLPETVRDAWWADSMAVVVAFK